MLEQQDVMGTTDRESVRADLDQAMMAAFCRALNASGLTPMSVMSVMAGALGAVYRQVADSHRRGECPCGWQPLGSARQRIALHADSGTRLNAGTTPERVALVMIALRRSLPPRRASAFGVPNLGQQGFRKQASKTSRQKKSLVSTATSVLLRALSLRMIWRRCTFTVCSLMRSS